LESAARSGSWRTSGPRGFGGLDVTDWEDKLAELERSLAGWYARFDVELDQLRRRRRRWFRRLTPGELDELEREARAAAGEEPLAQASQLLAGLSLHYLASLPGERALIRARVGDHAALFRFFWSYLQSLPEQVADEPSLRLALAAASMHDLRSDIAAVNDLLARIWLRAEEVGIDPAPHFQAVAQVSNRATGGGGAHFREHLAGFASSTYFRDVVQPRRARGRRAKAS
jgi:hypothetical protein